MIRDLLRRLSALETVACGRQPRRPMYLHYVQGPTVTPTDRRAAAQAAGLLGRDARVMFVHVIDARRRAQDAE